MKLNKIKLKKVLENSISELNGEFVKKNTNYEIEICNKITDFEVFSNRYWDCVWDDIHIEFKKGKNIWFDLIRYSEILLKKNEDSIKETITMFFIPCNNREKIVLIYCVNTSEIIDKIGLNFELANHLININNRILRSVNAQANLTIRDIEEISFLKISLY